MPIEIPLTQGRFVLVDEIDAEWARQFKWFVTNGYPARYCWKPKPHIFYMHREIAVRSGFLVGYYEDERITDHRDRDKLNAQRSNLRAVDYTLSNANRAARTPSGFQGVYKHSQGGKWGAEARRYGERIRRYGFATAEEAAEWRASAITEKGWET